MTFNFAKPRWSSDQNAALTSLWSEGLSGSAIGKRLDKTKCAVIGRARRLGLPARAEKREWEATEIIKIRGLKKAGYGIYEIAKKTGIPYSTIKRKLNEPVCHKQLSDLGPRDCRYPFGEGTPYEFCGRPAIPGKSYCAEHFNLCHQNTKPIEDAA